MGDFMKKENLKKQYNKGKFKLQKNEEDEEKNVQINLNDVRCYLYYRVNKEE